MKNKSVQTNYADLGFEVVNGKVWAYGQVFDQIDPLKIYLKVYQTNESSEFRYQGMYHAFCILWPDQVLTYNYWMERMFREHCNNETEIFTLAGGGGIGKTQGMAFVGALFIIANPKNNTVIVASTEIASLKQRIYGYLKRAIEECSIYPQLKPLLKISDSSPPSIRFGSDLIHGVYGVAAKLGDDEKTIKSIIGRHPRNSILVILDEATDMPIGIIAALPNLKKGLAGRFQCVAIGNSSSWTDLHGILSTPKVGKDNIDPHKDFRWETTQPKGICLYFNPYDSPAIHEKNLIKKAALGNFLMTEAKIIAAERDEGVESEAFWRFTMGYWKNASTEKLVVSEAFLKTYDPTTTAEFSGKVPQIMVAGLDPAFSVGGDKCILRLGILGEHINGLRILEFKGPHLVFEIKIKANTGLSAELQIADEVIRICGHYKVPLNTLCIDASGAGRGLADVIQLRSQTGLTPTKMYSTNIGNRNVKSFDIVTTSPYEMWFKGREFISNRQIFGMDPLAYGQLFTRLFIEKNGKKDLEKKDEYKKRMGSTSSVFGRSPDECDAAMLCIQAAMIHHGFFPGQRSVVPEYATPDHRRFAEATESYIENFQKPQIKLDGGYKGALIDIINKRMF